MAFVFTSATDYPVSFDECKAMILEVYSALRRALPLSMEFMKLNFTLRVLTYRLAKHSCPLSWTTDDVNMIKSFEFAFPELSITIPEDQLRHKLCTCIPAAELQNNEEKAKELAVAISKIGEVAVEARVERAVAPTEDAENDSSSSTDNETGSFEQNAADLQFGDVNMSDYDDSDESDTNGSSPNTSYELTSSIPSAHDNLEQLSLETLVKNASDGNYDIPIAAVKAIDVIGVSENRPANSGEDLTEIVVIHRKYGLSYELWDEHRQTIAAFKTMPTMEQLRKILYPLHHSAEQIWRIYFTLRRMAGVKIPDVVIKEDLRTLSLLSIPCEPSRFLL